MKRLVLFVLVVFGIYSYASVFDDVAVINKGVDGYIVGKQLTQNQQQLLKEKSVPNSNPNVKSFLANKDLLIAVNAQNLKVLAINKRYHQISQENIQKMMSRLIYDYEEPTAMAHEKMIYWIWDADGKKLSEDDLKAWKDSLNDKNKKTLADFVKKDNSNSKKKADFNPYVSVKLSADKPIIQKQEKPELIDAYLIISSDKLITSTVALAK